MESPWRVHEQSTLHVLSMDSPWTLMDSPWILHVPTHGLSMGSSWTLHVFGMESPWTCHGFSIWILNMKSPYGLSMWTLHMDPPWTLHGLSMDSPWPLHGLSMDSAWIPHGLRWTIYGHLQKNEAHRGNFSRAGGDPFNGGSARTRLRENPGENTA